eukprot:6524688-Pyramimonas_sp.AAC.1
MGVATLWGLSHWDFRLTSLWGREPRESVPTCARQRKADPPAGSFGGAPDWTTGTKRVKNALK